MIGLGLASSHAPGMFCPPELWPKVYAAIPEYTKLSQPQTAQLETPEVIRGYVERIDAAFRILREQLEAYRADAVIFVGDDQEDMFDKRCNPALCLFTGEEVWGSAAPFYGVLLISVQKVTVRASPQSEHWHGVGASSTRKCLSRLEFLLVSRSAAEGLFAWSISAASTRFRCSL